MLLHELCHYIPARWLGMNPHIDASWRRTNVEPASPIKSLIVLLFPATLGIIMLFAISFGLRDLLAGNSWQRITFYCIFALFAVWFSGSASDIYRAIYFARTRRWKRLEPKQDE